jgi:hypothetical protein
MERLGLLVSHQGDSNRGTWRTRSSVPRSTVMMNNSQTAGTSLSSHSVNIAVARADLLASSHLLVLMNLGCSYGDRYAMLRIVTRGAGFLYTRNTHQASEVIGGRGRAQWRVNILYQINKSFRFRLKADNDELVCGAQCDRDAATPVGTQRAILL